MYGNTESGAKSALTRLFGKDTEGALVFKYELYDQTWYEAYPATYTLSNEFVGICTLVSVRRNGRWVYCDIPRSNGALAAATIDYRNRYGLVSS
jgi:hypothetical protein